MTPEFTTDWRASIAYWPELFAELGLVGKPGLRFLEVGCFEGRTTLWLLEHVLTDPTSRITVVDPFAMDGQLDRFERNLAGYFGGRLTAIVGASIDVLRAEADELAPLDFVYVDGDHSARAVLADAVLAWPLLRPGGTIVFDDYLWPEIPDDLDKPGVAVDAFVRCYAREIALASVGGKDQLVVRKNP